MVVEARCNSEFSVENLKGRRVCVGTSSTPGAGRQEELLELVSCCGCWEEQQERQEGVAFWFGIFSSRAALARRRFQGSGAGAAEAEAAPAAADACSRQRRRPAAHDRPSL